MKITYEGNEVVVRVPCSAKDVKDAPASKSGKSKMVGTTSGFVAVEGAPPGTRVSVNLIAKP